MGKAGTNSRSHRFFNQKNFWLAPADSADSLTARFSTWVMPDGTAMMILGLNKGFPVIMNFIG